jgi:hypothetical protein
MADSRYAPITCDAKQLQTICNENGDNCIELRKPLSGFHGKKSYGSLALLRGGQSVQESLYISLDKKLITRKQKENLNEKRRPAGPELFPKRRGVRLNP